MMSANMQPQVSTVLRKCILQEQPGHASQHYRPYETNYTDDIASKIASTQRGASSTFAPGILRDGATGLIQPSSVTQGELGIANGWGERRAAIFLEIESTSSYGTVREVISGFTDHVGMTATGAIDQRMKIWPNNYIKYRVSTATNSTGVHASASVDQNTQILHGLGQEQNYGLRPTDAFAYMSHQQFDSDVLDPRVSINVAGMTSDRKNTIPSQYLHKVFKGYQEANNDMSGFGGDNYLYNMAADGAAETDPNTYPFFRMMDNACGYFSTCLLYTSPSPRDQRGSRMPSSA